ncbi:MAG: hypothetical protein PVH61_44545 [Candidatus Aminicenantes bacterium]|jgi:hypothetical protein
MTEFIKELISDINKILSNYGINEEIRLQDLNITQKTVSDIVKPNSKLSNAIINFLWPRIASATVYHYTSKEAAENILKTGIFRLNNISNRYSEGEIVTFCQTHQLQGYLKKEKNGYPTYRSLIMPNTFYASFTDTAITTEREEYFWRAFAACDGVRLKFKVVAKYPDDFRKVRYEHKKYEPIGLLYDLTNCIKNKYKRDFVLTGISRLCSFYLSGKDYGIENEYRLLYRVWEGSQLQPKTDGSLSYIELPLNVKSKCRYELEVTEVHSRERPDMPDQYVFAKRA